jgi:type VI secretion system FHA domain protein
MNLTLEVVNLRDPASALVPRKVFGPQGGIIGRSPDCDWVLTNPYISRHHATVRCIDGLFYIESNSAHGVALNNPQELIPRQERRPLKNGDHLYLDEYEVAVSIGHSATEAVGQTAHIPPMVSTGDDCSAERVAARTPRGLVEPIEPAAEDLDFLSKLGAAPHGPERGSSRQEISWNHSPVEHDHFKPPPIPERARAPARSAAPAAPMPAAAIPSGYLTTINLQPSVETAQAAPSDRIPPFEVEELLDPTRPSRRLQAAPVSESAPPRQESPTVAPSPAASVTESARATAAVRPASARTVPPAKPPSSPAPAPRTTPSAAVHTGPRAEGFDFAALLRSAGLDPMSVPAETIASFGVILRSVVQGLVEVLQARAEIKDQLRMSLTRVKTEENNPLKFAANAESALALLLGPRNPAFLPPVAAFEDALSDIRFHQMAMLAGMRAAFDHVLDSFEPRHLQERFDKRAKPAGLLALGAKPRYWEQYALEYRELTEDRDTAFQRLFGVEFAKAYEKQLATLKRTQAKVAR